MNGLVVVTPPKEEPCSLDELRQQCRVTDTNSDGLLEGYLEAARDLLQVQTNRAFLAQTLALTLNGFPRGGVIRLPRAPLTGVQKIEYIDLTGQTQTLSPTVYVVDTSSTPGKVTRAFGQVWPPTLVHPTAVTVTYDAGYGGVADVPAAIKQAIRLLVGHWFSNREAVVTGTIATDLPRAVEHLIGAHRVLEFA